MINGSGLWGIEVADNLSLGAVLDNLLDRELFSLCEHLIDCGYYPESVEECGDAISRQLYRMRVLGLDLEKTSIETLEGLLNEK